MNDICIGKLGDNRSFPRLTARYRGEVEEKDKISVEMVFRSLYDVAKAFVRGENLDVVVYLAERAKLFCLVKALRQREALSQIIWEAFPLS